MSQGFRVFNVPEAATIVITGGGMWKDYKEMTPDQQLAFEGKKDENETTKTKQWKRNNENENETIQKEN